MARLTLTINDYLTRDLLELEVDTTLGEEAGICMAVASYMGIDDSNRVTINTEEGDIKVFIDGNLRMADGMLDEEELSFDDEAVQDALDEAMADLGAVKR